MQEDKPDWNPAAMIWWPDSFPLQQTFLWKLGSSSTFDMWMHVGCSASNAETQERIQFIENWRSGGEYPRVIDLQTSSTKGMGKVKNSCSLYESHWKSNPTAAWVYRTFLPNVTAAVDRKVALNVPYLVVILTVKCYFSWGTFAKRLNRTC